MREHRWIASRPDRDSQRRALTTDDLLSLLRCPRCQARFALESHARIGDGEFGILRCHCDRYPLVDGIPIILKAPVGMFEHTTGTAQVMGVSPARLVDLIVKEKYIEALLECLAFPILHPRLRRLVGWQISTSAPVTRFARWICKRRLRSEVLTRRGSISAVELFEFFYQPLSPLYRAVGDYFTLRFAQPRHLAALALLEHMPASVKPLLDIACGCGHIEHYLYSRPDPVRVIGLDVNFYHLWIARHWIAPAGQYVCANAGDGLPFHDDSFAGTLCSDAYHLIPNRARLMQEIRRCAPRQLTIVTRVGNSAVMPNEGLENTLSGYLEEIGGADTRAFDESTLAKCYLARRDPLAFVEADMDCVTRGKWLSFIWNLPESRRTDAPDSRRWPHELGVLGINPIYRAALSANDHVQLRFEFPGIWYAYENHEMLSYHPRQVSLSAIQLDALKSGCRHDSFPELISQFVLIGMPRRFAPSSP
jgi:SAM-dependent methyltransferase/uncharacterized protein YbaR (Trm112 family)